MKIRRDVHRFADTGTYSTGKPIFCPQVNASCAAGRYPRGMKPIAQPARMHIDLPCVTTC